MDSGNRTAEAKDEVAPPQASERLAIRWMFPAGPGPITFLDEASVIGREGAVQTRLEGEQVSRRHAEVRLSDGRPMLCDLDSRNGSYVNGEKRPHSPLGAGDVVRLGEWVGVVARVPAPDPGFAIWPFGLAAGPLLGLQLHAAERAAKSGLPIVITGETGTGKELTAKLIHAASKRKGKLVPLNCALLTEELAASLLFGHVRGAFTGATHQTDGCFRQANDGTLFLDEIVDLPLAVQPQLLRALQSGEVRRVGDDAPPSKVTVSIVVAAQESLRTAVSERRFRSDLLARLEVLTIDLPPLRERREDVPFLLAYILAGKKDPPKLTALAVEALCLYDWPFNVRELVNVVEATLARHGSERVIERRHLPERFHFRGTASTPPVCERPPDPPASRDENELEALLAALREHKGNVTAAANAVGISRSRAYRLMGHEAVDPERYRDATLR